MASTSGKSSVNNSSRVDGSSVCQFEINGDFSGDRVKKIEDEFLEVLSAIAYKKVVLDISAVNNFDSPGLALCIGLYKECQNKKMDFEIIANQDSCNLFKLVNLDQVFPIKEIK